MKRHLFILLTLFACNRSQMELEELPDNQKHSVNTSRPAQSKKVNNTSAVKVNDLVRRPLFSIARGEKHTLFHNLPAASSFMLSAQDEKLLSGLLTFFKRYDSHSFDSRDEYEVARFLSALLSAAAKNEDEYVPRELNSIRQYALPLMLNKSISKTHQMPISFKKITEISENYYKRGFNLNNASSKELHAYLGNFNEVIYKGRRGGFVDVASITERLKSLHRYMNKDEVAQFKKLVSNFTRNVQVHKSHITFSKFELATQPRNRDRGAMQLSVFKPGKPGDTLVKMVAEVLKAPAFSYGIVLPDRQFKEKYLLLAAGKCALCFTADDIPGDHTLPKNLRRMDWSKYGQKVVSVLMDKEAGGALDSCVPSLLDLIDRFNVYMNGGKGFPGETSKGHRLSKQYTDGEILKALWIKAFLQHMVLSSTIEGAVLKPGCKLSPVHYAAYRFMLENSLATQGSFDTLVNALYIRGLFAQFPKRKVKGAKPEPDKDVNQKKLTYPSLDNFFTKKEGAFLFDTVPLKERLERLLEQLSGLHGDPVKWLEGATPTVDHLLSKSRRATIKKLYLAQMPYHRVYLPALITISRSRVLFTHAEDALDYFLSRY